MNFVKSLLSTSSLNLISKATAAGRWYAQPAWCRAYSTSPDMSEAARNELNEIIYSAEEEALYSYVPSDEEVTAATRIPTSEEFGLDKAKAAPKYVVPRGSGKPVYKLVPGRNGEQLANYVLFTDSIQRSVVNYNTFRLLESDERDIYSKHLKAIEYRKLEYVDPYDKKTYKTVSALLYEGKCCGEGDELSVHRSRPPTTGIRRRTRCIVVDNSALGKEANTCGKLAYCIHVYKTGFRKRHMPPATLGDKILVAIRGQMKRAYVVGACTHGLYRKHGVPSTDTNNIVLLDDDGNPMGTRILAPIPSTLLKQRDQQEMSKILALANKFI